MLKKHSNGSYIIIPIPEFSYKSESAYLATSYQKSTNSLRINFCLAGEQIANELQLNTIYIPQNLVSALIIKGEEVWVPHFSHDELENIEHGTTIVTYMQMVLPFFFTVSKGGWGGKFQFDEKSQLVAEIQKKPKLENFLNIIKQKNITKISQDDNYENNLSEYDLIFFGQIPHDRIITNFNAISPIQAITRLVACAKKMDLRIALKPHPLHKNWHNYYGSVLDYLNVIDPSLHVTKAIKKTKIVATVNSGVGVEAMIRCKPVMVFGECDYETAVLQCRDKDIDLLRKDIRYLLTQAIDAEYYNLWLHRYFIENNFFLNDWQTN